jgi:hypothetical protein
MSERRRVHKPSRVSQNYVNVMVAGILGLVFDIVGTISVILDDGLDQAAVRTFDLDIEEISTSLLRLSIG